MQYFPIGNHISHCTLETMKLSTTVAVWFTKFPDQEFTVFMLL